MEKQICVGAFFGVSWAFLWSYWPSKVVESWLAQSFIMGGPQSPGLLAVCLVLVALIVTGPVERHWKNTFKATTRQGMDT